jgi:hypothetical protein
VALNTTNQKKLKIEIKGKKSKIIKNKNIPVNDKRFFETK